MSRMVTIACPRTARKLLICRDVRVPYGPYPQNYLQNRTFWTGIWIRMCAGTSPYLFLSGGAKGWTARRGRVRVTTW